MCAHTRTHTHMHTRSHAATRKQRTHPPTHPHAHIHTHTHTRTLCTRAAAACGVSVERMRDRLAPECGGLGVFTPCAAPSCDRSSDTWGTV
jgi:hypothetical protein